MTKPEPCPCTMYITYNFTSERTSDEQGATSRARYRAKQSAGENNTQIKIDRLAGKEF